MIGLRSPELMNVDCTCRNCYGASQDWYPEYRRRLSGCGPTACSNQMWYLAKTQPSCRYLCPYNSSTQSDFLSLMQDVWHYVTPGPFGLWSAHAFARGAVRYAEIHNVQLNYCVMGVPFLKKNRPSELRLYNFLAGALSDDLPVAFLNLSNGDLWNLDSWHWVTLTGIDGRLQAVMADDGFRQTIDLACWLKTSMLGGGFVAIRPQNEPIV